MKDAFGNKEAKFFDFPCGKCSQCKRNYQEDWTTRLMMEANIRKYCKFVTLTYSDDYVPVNSSFFMTLDVKDCQNFFKKLRKKGNVVRYYLLGEYGPHTLRPHYHFIMFSDIEVSYEDLVNSWDKGFVTVANLTVGRMAYCSKHHLLPELPVTLDVIKPFVLMSRRPGIGCYYGLDPKFLQWIQDDTSRNFTYVNGTKRRLPRYTKRQVFSINQQVINYETLIKKQDNEYRYLLSKGQRIDVKSVEARNVESIRRRSKNSKL